MSNVKCNKCGRDFPIEAIKRNIFMSEGNTYYVQYFICNHCNKVYPFLIADEELQKDLMVVSKIKVQILREKNNTKPSQPVIRILEKSLKIKMDKIKSRELELKEKFKDDEFIYGVKDEVEFIRYRKNKTDKGEK